MGYFPALKRGVFVFALAFAVAGFFAPQGARAARLLTSGFETNDGNTGLNTEWDSVSGTAAAISLDTATVHAGTYSLKINVANQGAAVQRNRASVLADTDGLTSYFVRAYVNFTAFPTSQTMLINEFNTSSSSPMGVYINASNQLLIKDDSSGFARTSAVTLSTNTWYRIELRTLVSSSIGEIELKLYQGEQIAIENLIIAATDTLPGDSDRIDRFLFGIINSTTATMYMDDVAVNRNSGAFQTSWTGPGKTALIKPDSDVSVAWTKTGANCSGTSNFDCVDDEPGTPDDASGYTQATAAATDRLGLTDLPVEVPAGATIVLLDLYTRHGSDGASGSRLENVALWDENSTKTNNGSNTDCRKNGFKIANTDEHLVFDAAGKTKANINSFNGGYDWNAGTCRNTALWVNVEWQSEPPTPNLLQEDFLFENDSSSSVKKNTNPVSAGTARANVEKGERFITRFLLSNNGSSATTAIFQIQYDRNDGNWKSVTSGEISIQYGVSGDPNSPIADGSTLRRTTQHCLGTNSNDVSTFDYSGRWSENSASLLTSYTINDSECTELAWVFSTATATVGTTYRLRLFNQTANKILAGYTATPTLTIVSSQDRKHSKTGTSEGELLSVPADANDLTYYLDATGYSAVAADDSRYDTATSFRSNSVPVSLFKIRNTNNNNTDQITITWNGHSNAAPSVTSVSLDIWNNTLSAWVTASTNNWSAANTDFTFSSVTSGTAFFDGSFFFYLRVRQAASKEALRTDLISATFAAAGGGGGTAALTQRAFTFENDNGDTVNRNTGRGTGIAYPVEKGERFTVRFQVDNTGDGATTAKFAVQYDRSDGAWMSVTSGEISPSLGISGANGDALQSNKAGSCQGGTSFVNGTWHEGTATTNSFTLTNGNCTEFGFIFSTATAVPRTTYRFRLVNGTNGNQVLNSVATPSIVLITFQEKSYSKTGLGAELAAAPTVSDDLTYFLDATGYAAVAADDGVYDTATSTGAGNVPLSLFKIRNPWADTIQPFTVNWNGQSSVAPSSKNVFLDIWNGSSNAWLNLAQNTSAGANADFSFSSVTSGAALFDPNFFVYLRVRQAAGVEELRSDLISISFGPPPGPQVDRADVISDSRPGVSANHTVSFIINSGFDASEFLELDWPADFAFPPDLDCGDVDVATGTQFTLSTTSTGCEATANTWGALFMSDTRVFRLTAPSTAGTYVATGTQITITIGLNASSQQSGTTQIVNPSTVGSYALDVGGPVGTGRMLVAIAQGVTVEATVAETLTVTVASVAAGSCTADDGASVTPVDTTPGSVPFGTIGANAFYIGCQDVTVSVNAGGGYSLTSQEDRPMQTAGGVAIPDTTCDAGGCTESAGAAWTNASNNGFGHTCRNQVNHDCASAYSNGTNFRQFANISGGETAEELMVSSTPVRTVTGRVKFRLSAGSAQAAGTYTTTIVYIVTPTF